MYQYPYGNAQQLNLDWILKKLKELEEAQGQQITVDLEVISNALLAASYSNSNTYNRSDVVFHDGKLYRANVNIPTPEGWNPSHWDEIMLGDTVANLVRYVGSLSNNQVFNSSLVSGTHTSDALNNLKTDLDDVTEELDNTLENKTAVDFSAATQGKYVSYSDGTVYDHTDYQVLRHVILEKGQTIYVTTYATSNVAPLSLEVSGPVMQPLCQGTDSTSSFYYTATSHCQITVCTNFVEAYSCYIAGAFVSLTDGVNDLYNNVDNLNGAITSLNNRYPIGTFNTVASLISSISQNDSESVGICSITSVLMLQLSGIGRPATLIWKYLPITGYDEIEYFVFNDAIEAYGYIKISTSTVSRAWASKYVPGDTLSRRFIQAAGRIVNAKNAATLGVVLDKPIASGTSLTITFSTGESDNFYPATPQLYTIMRNANADINTLIDKTGNISILSQREDGTLLITIPFIVTLSDASASASGVVGLVEANIDITFS